MDSEEFYISYLGRCSTFEEHFEGYLAKILEITSIFDSETKLGRIKVIDRKGKKE